MGGHPPLTDVGAAAAGDPEARRRLAPHLGECAACRERLAELLGVLAAATSELATGRPGCPDAELLAELPPGAEDDDPHVRWCPLCREELALLRRLETQRRLHSAFEAGTPIRPEVVTHAASPWLQEGPGPRAEVDLTGDSTVDAEVGGVHVRLKVAGGELEVEVAGQPTRPLELILENELLERRIPLRQGRETVPVGRWLKARVRSRAKGER